MIYLNGCEWLSRNNVGRICQHAKLSSENYRVKTALGTITDVVSVCYVHVYTLKTCYLRVQSGYRERQEKKRQGQEKLQYPDTFQAVINICSSWNVSKCFLSLYLWLYESI